MGVPTSVRAAQPDDSRLSVFYRMVKQLRTNSELTPPPRGAASKPRPDAPRLSKPEPVETSTATVGTTIVIKGDIAGKGDVVVSGTVEGSIDLADHRVTVETTGRVQGDIVGKQVQVKGSVTGDIEAADLLSVSSTGTVKGNIAAPRVAVEDGAKCECRIDMNFGRGRDAQSATSLPKK